MRNCILTVALMLQKCYSFFNSTGDVIFVDRSEIMEKDMSEKKRLTISLPAYVLEDLEKMAKDKGVTKSILIMLALEEYKKGQK